MPKGKGTYGTKRGRPPKKEKIIMEQVDYSTIERLRFNGTDINNFFC